MRFPLGPGREAEAILLCGQHLQQLPAAREERVEQLGHRAGERAAAGRTRSAKRARIAASIASVFASCPVPLAKSRIWRGLATTTGCPPPPGRRRPPVHSRRWLR